MRACIKTISITLIVLLPILCYSQEPATKQVEVIFWKIKHTNLEPARLIPVSGEGSELTTTSDEETPQLAATLIKLKEKPRKSLATGIISIFTRSQYGRLTQEKSLVDIPLGTRKIGDKESATFSLGTLTTTEVKIVPTIGDDNKSIDLSFVETSKLPEKQTSMQVTIADGQIVAYSVGKKKSIRLISAKIVEP